MATATKKVAGAKSRARGAAAGSDRAPLAFVISQCNGGDYLWEIVDGEGTGLVHSDGFASRDDAERAAHRAHECARLAHFESRDRDERKTAAV